MKLRALAGVAAIASAAVVCPFAVAATAEASSITPSALQSAVLKAGDSEHSVHYVSAIVTGGTKVKLVCNVGRTQGMQQITFVKGASTGNVTVVVLNDTAYVRGNAYALNTYMGFPSADADKYANEWILIPHTNSGYKTVASGVTLASAMGELSIPGSLSRVSETKINGQYVVGVRGNPTMTNGKSIPVTLYARARGLRLPVEETSTDGTSGSITTFSNWNERVKETAPTTSVPIADVTVGQ